MIKSTLHRLINSNFMDENRLVIPCINDGSKFSNWMKILSPDGKVFFNWDEAAYTIETTMKEYNVDKLKSTDVVLDIGASIGGYGLQIADRVKHVYMLEPMIPERIEANIELSRKYGYNLDNVTVIHGALSRDIKELSLTNWATGKKVTAPCYTLEDLINQYGKFDVIKCDCEGGEWSIKPTELYHVRKIDVEVHFGTIKYPKGSNSFLGKNEIIYTEKCKTYLDFVRMLESVGFTCNYSVESKTTALVHGMIK